MRGALTPRVAEAAKRALGKDITQVELRLIPYVAYVMVNEQILDPQKMNAEERKILSDWRKRGWIEGGVSGLAITRQFWDAMNEIIWLAYVAYRDEDEDEDET